MKGKHTVGRHSSKCQVSNGSTDQSDKSAEKSED
jgi:hypothetical protein